ncbi:MAG: hypothetical protein KGY41_08130, partial [Desulfovermiculus sp.]|nr:hypothetical protein [Desulfovermiculus sp.]
MQSRSDPQAGSWVHTVHLEPPSVEDNTADVDRLLRALVRESDLPGLSCDLELMSRIPHILRDNAFSVRCTLFSDGRCTVLTAVGPGSPDQPSLGLAIDLGTTRYVLQIVDLVSGLLLGKRDRPNPQSRFGPDILTRIHHAAQENGLWELQNTLIQDINQALEDLCREKGVSTQAIHNIALAGI